MKLTTAVKNYIIIFPDRSRRIITESQNKKICQLLTQDTDIMVRINGAQYPITMLKHSAIMPLEEFYEQYPDERPAAYSDIVRIFDARPVYDKDEARQGLLEGLNNYVKSNPNPKSQTLFAKLGKNYERPLDNSVIHL